MVLHLSSVTRVPSAPLVIMKIIAALFVLGLFLLAFGELERLLLTLDWERSLFLSRLDQILKRMEDQTSLSMPKTLNTLDTQAMDASSRD